MLIKDIKLSKEDIKNIIDKYNLEYGAYISRKNILLRTVGRCENKSKETLI